MRAREFVLESSMRIPRAIEEFLDGLNPDDCGVEDIGAYRIHFEGFTSDCKSSSDYRRDPDAVYQQVYRDFIQREGGQKPVMQDMVGDEDFPILFSIFRRKQTVAESTTATAKQVLSYVNQTHHEPFRSGEKMHAAVMAHPRWQLQRVPLLNLNIPDQEYDDVDYDEYEPEADPYGRVMMVEPEHAGEVSQHLIDRKPIVIDADRYIIDGNHRAWAAKYLLNRDYIMAWVPVTQNMAEDSEPKSQRAHRSGIDLEAWQDGLHFQITATAHGRDLGRVVFDVQYLGNQPVLVAQDLMIQPKYRGQGIAAIMYDYAKELGYQVERSREQTDAGRAFWNKNRGEQGTVWENKGE